MKEFSDILNEALEKQERTNRWLAEKTGINPTSIGDYRNGKTKPSIDRAILIAKILSIDLSECYGEKELNGITNKDGSGKYLNQIHGREGVIEIPLFPQGSDLLSSLKHSQRGYFIDVSMAREKIVVVERLAHDGVCAAMIDHFYDAEDVLGDAIVIWPLDAEELKNTSIILLIDIPPSKLYIRKLALVEKERLVLKSPLKDEAVIDRGDQRIIGKIKAAINFFD